MEWTFYPGDRHTQAQRKVWQRWWQQWLRYVMARVMCPTSHCAIWYEYIDFTFVSKCNVNTSPLWCQLWRFLVNHKLKSIQYIRTTLKSPIQIHACGLCDESFDAREWRVLKRTRLCQQFWLLLVPPNCLWHNTVLVMHYPCFRRNYTPADVLYKQLSPPNQDKKQATLNELE